MTFSWPFGAFAASLLAARNWRSAERDYGFKTALDMYWLALRHSIPPLEYAMYRLDIPERRKNKHEYVYWVDLPGLAALVARQKADNRDVQDKDRFAEICARRGYPYVPTLAIFAKGKQQYPAGPFTPTEAILWTKALRLKGSAGAARWFRQGDTYRDEGGRLVAASDMASEFRKTDCIVQPFVENHPDIAKASNGALASLRIVTGMNTSGKAEFVTSMLGLPQGTGTTSIGAICCSIDPTTGHIRFARQMGGAEVTHHPNTGTVLSGLAIPFWQDSLDLVLRAHAEAFARFPFLGWDIAITADGPVLLETNSGWGAIFHQMLDGPIGHTAFSRLVEQYV